jgi:hypothetical protein
MIPTEAKRHFQNVAHNEMLEMQQALDRALTAREHEFKAADRAAQNTGIEWVALYNDFEVARTVNETLKERHIGFAGGSKDGSIHHGPAPYLLHIHFNIMPAGDLVPRTFGP